MKHTKAYLTMLATALTTVACTGDDPMQDLSYTGNPGSGSSWQGTADGNVSSDLSTLDVAINTSATDETLDEPDATDTYYEDYVETYEPTATISVTYDGQTATIDGAADGVTVQTNGAHVTVNSTAKGVSYVLKGTTSDGAFKIYSDKKFLLTLNGVDITNPTGAAINNQGKRCYLHLADGTANILADGESYQTPDDEDEKGTLFSEGKLAISGKGSLSVSSKGKNGIASDDYVLLRPQTNVYVKSSSGHGVKTNDGIVIRGGVLNVEVSAAGAKGINTEAGAIISGGRTTLIATGEPEYDTDERDYKGAAAIKVDSCLTMTGGQLLAKATGNGGKAVNVDGQLTVSGGTITAVAAGSNYGSGSSSVSAKAIKADGALTVTAGVVMARAKAHEAIETKGDMTVEGGYVMAYSSDDAINSAGAMTVKGGYVYGLATANDGIDSNGNLTVTGGVLIGIGATAPEEGIDCAEGKTFSVNGGTVVGLGGGGESISGSQQKQSISGVSVSSGNYLAVTTATGNALMALRAPRAYSGATLQLSSPLFQSGTTYTLCTATSATAEETFMDYLAAPALTGTTTLTTFTTATTTSGSMGGISGGGGMGGGRR